MKIKLMRLRIRWYMFRGDAEKATESLLAYAEHRSRMTPIELPRDPDEPIHIGNLLEQPEYPRRLMEGIASKVYPYAGDGTPEWMRMERVLKNLSWKEKIQLWIFNLFYPEQPAGKWDPARFPASKSDIET